MNERIESLYKRYPILKCCQKEINSAIELAKQCYKNGNKIITCGNGGSAADAEHIVGELLKGFCRKRPIPQKLCKKIQEVYPEDLNEMNDNLQTPLPAISLTSHMSFTTAYNNDVNPEFTFAQQLLGLGKKGDVLIALSTSGNSKNVINACKLAKVLDVKTIAITGKSGGRLKKLCDVSICVPEEDTDIIQEYHVPIYHAICKELETEFFEE